MNTVSVTRNANDDAARDDGLDPRGLASATSEFQRALRMACGDQIDRGVAHAIVHAVVRAYVGQVVVIAHPAQRLEAAQRAIFSESIRRSVSMDDGDALAFAARALYAAQQKDGAR